MCACVCMCVCVCVRACVCMCVCVRTLVLHNDRVGEIQDMIIEADSSECEYSKICHNFLH